MNSEGRKRLLLAVLAMILAAVVYRAWPQSVSNAVSRSSVSTTASAPAGEISQGPTGLNLAVLTAERQKPVGVRRNLFRFADLRPASDREPAPDSSRVVARPSLPPPRAVVAQIPLKLIGIVETPGQSERVAVLSDERGVYHGREGDIIEGRYRILRITVESVEVSRIDGDTRHVIRLSGSSVP